MAQQKGIIKLTGTIGDISFFKSADGYLAREKGGVEADKIAKDPAFQRTRENGAEFGRAGKAAKLLRSSFQQLLQNSTDRLSISRLVRLMMTVIKADLTSQRGLRNVIDGEAELLEKFEFNEAAKLNSSLFASYVPAIDRVTGKLSISLPPFVPGRLLVAPPGATHFRIISGGASVDFEANKFVSDVKTSDILVIGNDPTAVIDLVNEVDPNSTSPLFLALGIEFYQMVNGNNYPLKNGAFNPMAIVKVATP